MKPSLWFLTRLSAALVGAIIAGIAAAIIYSVLGFFECGRACTGDLPSVAATGLWFAYSIAAGMFWTLPAAITLGLLPGTVALTVTPAAVHPWRALPVLLIATILGFGIWIYLAQVFRMEYGPWEIATLLVVPSAAGFAAASQLKRFQYFL